MAKYIGKIDGTDVYVLNPEKFENAAIKYFEAYLKMAGYEVGENR